MTPPTALLAGVSAAGLSSRLGHGVGGRRLGGLLPHRQGRRTYCLGSRYGLKISAIAAPEKTTNSAEAPFTAWGTAKQRVKKRDDLK